MKHLYLVLAIVGAVGPYVFFIDFMGAHGLDLGGFVAAAFVNGAAGGLTTDLVISSVVFWVLMARQKGPNPWPFVVINLLIGLSCALPAYLYMADRQKGA